jgi:hypothetical protein
VEGAQATLHELRGRDLERRLEIGAPSRHEPGDSVLEHPPLLRQRPQRSEYIGVGIEGDHADAILGTELLDQR